MEGVLAAKLADLDRQVRDLQQAIVLYGLPSHGIQKRLQGVLEAIDDARIAAR